MFRLCCIEAISAAQVARKFRCSKATILNRLALIRSKTGIEPDKFRAVFPYLARFEAALSDPRARRISRQSAISQEDNPYLEE